ncbi:retinol dehydrogenase 12 [Anabrus simplex]|uniref:retinol dehydrogenase 12 n=1 Tax=Anabrus simplex TaxID=316456 RepID=UPI0035A36771
MVSSVVYIIFPILLAVGLIRKYREYQWGYCKSNSSLHGKVFLVTGANSGIGKETVRELVRRKARVIMACRDMKKARLAIEDIRRHESSGELIPMHLDLASLKSVRKFCEEVMKDFPKIHVLINNAGMYIPMEEKKKTDDGFEIHFGVNHLGHFLLTNLLLPRLKESAPSRIVIVSSALHEQGKIDFDDLNGEKTPTKSGRHNSGYCNSKLANMLFSIELAKRTQDSGVCVYALCPGFAYTGLFRSRTIKWYHYILFSPIALLYLRSAAQGAQTVIHCATCEEVEGESGLLYRNCTIYKPKKKLDPEVASKLWEVSEKLVGLKTSL